MRAVHGYQEAVRVTASEAPVAKDDDCLADLLKVKDLKGLEYCKGMTELVAYG